MRLVVIILKKASIYTQNVNGSCLFSPKPQKVKIAFKFFDDGL